MLSKPPHTQAEPAVTIHNFRQLRELELTVIRPKDPHKSLLSSITSTELRKIVFPAKYANNWVNFALRVRGWGLIDEQLCRLVDRLCATGYCRTLNVELQLMDIDDDPGDYDFTKFLPGFREKGVVTIIDVAHGDRLLHSSAHNR